MQDVAQNTPVKDSQGVFISTYGCQMNVNDTERMYSLLEMHNYTPVTSPDQASVIIINSCSVREKPVHKVHSEVGRYKKFKQANPNLKIGVAGCVAQQEKKQLMKDVPLIDFVFGPDAIDDVPNIVNKLKAGESKVVHAKFDHKNPYKIETLVRNPGVSTFVNIAKGCDNFCSFCIVPFTRGRERSRSLHEIILDVNTLVKRGVKEVTLLGQNVNSYASQCGADFGKLLKTLATETDIKRIRYTSPHPKDFNEDLIKIMQDHSNVICESLHMPLQSGNTEVLERMNRGYTREQFIEKANMILKGLPNVAMTTDIIVGFPGETHEQFMDTYNMLDDVPFEAIFAFKYSPRPFTKAARFTDQVPEDVKSERLNKLFEKHEEVSFELVKRYQDKVEEVLVENVRDGKAFGRNVQNKACQFLAPDSLVGEIVKVKIIQAMPHTLRGELVQ
ncbi:MAG: tRNA (N6-isopentenyl adenosine(37)-C2)-methylthiotransferase MiaB [Bdellovibrionales bacterium]|nr:tRNA (N6-isopentenyl adenosine(37)-C2)-methylthiotransferase MiaB [Bdellovibrionales bacterium]